FGVFAAEGAMLGFLAWALLFRRDTLSPGSLGLQSVLVGTITITAVCLAVVTGSVVVFRSVSGRREGRRAAEVASWARVWQSVVEDDAARPHRPLPAAAVAALLECREALAGPEAQRVAALISSTGVERLLLDRLRDLPATGRRWWSRWVPGASRRLAAALDLLDDLARARLATAVPGLLSLAARPDPALRTMAIRAASRSIAATAPGPERAAATMA